jgi:hypothetical protein
LAEQDNIILVQQELSAQFNIRLIPSYASWLAELAAAINRLIQTDFTALVNILYRLDVSEARLKQVLAEQPGTNAGELIASLMVERHLEKIRTRAQFRKQDDIPDDEKW